MDNLGGILKSCADGAMVVQKYIGEWHVRHWYKLPTYLSHAMWYMTFSDPAVLCCHCCCAPGQPGSLTCCVPGQPGSLTCCVPGQPGSLTCCVPGQPGSLTCCVPGQPGSLTCCVPGQPGSLTCCAPGQPCSLTCCVPGHPGSPIPIPIFFLIQFCHF